MAETPQEAIRNALQLFAALAGPSENTLRLTYRDYVSITSRLHDALHLLDEAARTEKLAALDYLRRH